MVFTMEIETGNWKSVEVVFEHPAIDRTPKQLCTIRFLYKEGIWTHSGLDDVWTLPKNVKLVVFSFVLSP